MAILALTEAIYYSMSLFLRSVFKFDYSFYKIIGRHADKAKLTFRRPNEIFILAIFEENFEVKLSSLEIKNTAITMVIALIPGS